MPGAARTARCAVIDNQRSERGSTTEDGLSCLRGMAFHKKGEFDQAIKDYERAMLFPEDGLANFGNCGLYGRGLVKLKTGDTEGGRRDMEAARAGDVTAKHPSRYDEFFCLHGITAD